MVFLNAIQGLFSIIIIVSIGYLLTAKSWFNQETAELLPKLVNYIAVPTYMVWNLVSTFDKDHFVLLISGIIVPVISMLVNFVLGCFLSNILKLPPDKKGIFRSAFFCSSSIFIGVPVNLALFGETSIPYVLVYFLANASLFWTIGNYSISLSGKKPPAKLISIYSIKKVFSPPFISFCLGVILILLEIHPPKFIMDTLKYLGNMTTPLSMLFIGVAMFGVNLKKLHLSKDITAVLIGRFIISPLTVLAVSVFFPIPELMRKVFVIQAALPAMTQTAVLAKVYEANTEYAALLVSITTLLAVIAIPLYMVLI